MQTLQTYETIPTKATLKHPYWNIPDQTLTTSLGVDVKAEIYASDIRRRQISLRLKRAQELWAEWLSPSSKQSDQDLLQFHEDALVIIAQEGMEWERITDIAYLAHAYAALEDEVGFRQWGNFLISLSDWNRGKLQMKSWQEWVREPTSSPAWGLRVRSKANGNHKSRA